VKWQQLPPTFPLMGRDFLSIFPGPICNRIQWIVCSDTCLSLSIEISPLLDYFTMFVNICRILWTLYILNKLLVPASFYLAQMASLFNFVSWCTLSQTTCVNMPPWFLKLQQKKNPPILTLFVVCRENGLANSVIFWSSVFWMSLNYDKSTSTLV